MILPASPTFRDLVVHAGRAFWNYWISRAGWRRLAVLAAVAMIVAGANLIATPSFVYLLYLAAWFYSVKSDAKPGVQSPPPPDADGVSLFLGLLLMAVGTGVLVWMIRLAKSQEEERALLEAQPRIHYELDGNHLVWSDDKYGADPQFDFVVCFHLTSGTDPIWLKEVEAFYRVQGLCGLNRQPTLTIERRSVTLEDYKRLASFEYFPPRTSRRIFYRRTARGPLPGMSPDELESGEIELAVRFEFETQVAPAILAVLKYDKGKFIVQTERSLPPRLSADELKAAVKAGAINDTESQLLLEMSHEDRYRMFLKGRPNADDLDEGEKHLYPMLLNVLRSNQD